MDVLGERVFKESIASWDIKGINKVESSMVWSFILDQEQDDNIDNLTMSNSAAIVFHHLNYLKKNVD